MEYGAIARKKSGEKNSQKLIQIKQLLIEWYREKQQHLFYVVYGIPFCRPSNSRNSNPVDFSALT